MVCRRGVLYRPTEQDSFRVVEQTDDAKKASSDAGMLPRPLSGRSATRSLVVEPLNLRGPEFLTLKADVTSEIEITFKTIGS